MVNLSGRMVPNIWANELMEFKMVLVYYLKIPMRKSKDIGKMVNC